MNSLYHTLGMIVTSPLLRLLELVLVPTLFIVAAGVMWRSISRWISVTLLVAAGVKFLSCFAILLTHPRVQRITGGADVYQNRWTGILMGLLDWFVGIAFAMAVLAMARAIRKMTEQQNPELSPAAVASDEA